MTGQHVAIRSRLRVFLERHNLERAEAGVPRLSVRQLARETGVAHTSLAAWYAGKVKRIDFETLDKVMGYFGIVDVNLLLARTPDDDGEGRGQLSEGEVQ